MTEQELLKYMPHPKKCMADKFDSKAGVTCDNPRDQMLLVWWPFEEPARLASLNIPLHLCAIHATYRGNGGQGMGPIVLRAGAEHLRKLKELDNPPRRRVPRQKKETMTNDKR